MRSLAECLVCSGKRFSTFLESTFSGGPCDAAPFFLANRRGVVHGRVVSCQACGFRFTSPQFLPDDYDEIYKNAPGPDGTGITLEQGDTRRFRRLAKYVRRYAGGGGRFLDFGCGRGGFLAAMGDPAGIGLEVGEPGMFRAGPSLAITGRLFDVAGRPPFDNNSFDFITAFDVFEHLPDLDRYVRVLTSLLRPGGHLIVTVPDVGSWNAKLSGGRWNMYLLEHLWYFNRKTLRIFMERLGFQQIRHRNVPYDAPLAHIVRRVAQTYGFPPPPLGATLSVLVLPVPIGLMYGVFQRTT
jgi:SAM-dependent methyltransferase